MESDSNKFDGDVSNDMSSNNFSQSRLDGFPVVVKNTKTGSVLAILGDTGSDPLDLNDNGIRFSGNLGVRFGTMTQDWGSMNGGFEIVAANQGLPGVESGVFNSLRTGNIIFDDAHKLYDAAGNLLIDGQNGPVMMAASMAVGQSVPDSTNTNLVFDTLVHGNGVTYSAATGIATVNVAGWFRVSGQFSCGIGAANSTILNVMKNGANVHSSQLNGSSNNGAVIVDKLIQCAAGDTLNLMVWHNAGVAWTCSTSGTVFEINKIS